MAFADFWDLYDATSLDYQSPLKNFGTSQMVGTLEHEACREMVTKPIAALNIRFDNKRRHSQEQHPMRTFDDLLNEYSIQELKPRLKLIPYR